MAIFSKKTNTADAVDATEPKAISTVGLSAHMGIEVLPRLSEKATSLVTQNKYIFRVSTHVNKVELKKALEKWYGVKIASINVINVSNSFL